MAITLRGTATGTATDGGAVTVTHPAGIAQNDVVYIGLAVGDNDSTNFDLTMDTTGFTELVDLFFDNGVSDLNFGVFRKRQGVTPDSTAVTTAVGGIDAGNCAAEIVLIGVDTTTSEDATTTTASGGSSGIANPPAIDTVTANAWVVAFGFNAGTSVANQAFTDGPLNYINFNKTTGNDQSDSAIGVASLEIASPATENPGAYTVTGDSTLFGWGAATVAVRPAGGGEPTG